MKEKPEIKEVLQENNKLIRDKKYNEYVKKVTPTYNLTSNMAKAFVVGGTICVIGQGTINLYQSMGASKEDAKLYSTITLVLLSAIFTGLGWYSKLADFAGAGSLVPITGFANSVASAAIEFKKEGQVFGIGCRIFSIAGPVILYGVVFSWLLGVFYYISNNVFHL